MYVAWFCILPSFIDLVLFLKKKKSNKISTKYSVLAFFLADTPS